MRKLLKVVLGLIGVTAVGVVGVVVVVVVAAVVLHGTLPGVEVDNRCAKPIVMPEWVQRIPSLPGEIPANGTVTFPVVMGPGEYSLYEEEGGVYIRFPRSLPFVGDAVRVANAGAEPNVTFEGAQVTIPMHRQLEMDTSYSVVLCP